MTLPPDPDDVVPTPLTKDQALIELNDIRRTHHNVGAKIEAFRTLAAKVAMSTEMSEGDKSQVRDQLTRLIFDLEARLSET
jgi:nitric oxide synthase oxygenase domain/subunit